MFLYIYICLFMSNGFEFFLNNSYAVSLQGYLVMHWKIHIQSLVL